MADEILQIVRRIDPALDFKYNKFYIGLAKGGVTNNFAVCKPRKTALNLEIRLPKDEQLTAELEEAGLDLMDYMSKWGRYRIRLKPEDLKTNAELIEKILRLSHDQA